MDYPDPPGHPQRPTPSASASYPRSHASPAEIALRSVVAVEHAVERVERGDPRSALHAALDQASLSMVNPLKRALHLLLAPSLKGLQEPALVHQAVGGLRL